MIKRAVELILMKRATTESKDEAEDRVLILVVAKIWNENVKL